ncbi:MAG TPA: exodeoxyribonuclease III [Acidimicrobiia bacterium]|nr:exodeoxyribonuclease III [Acidimicrobiia bacterium]
MRIATWNVNSLKARLEAVEKWLVRAAPDVLLLQETKVADDDVPYLSFEAAGYRVVHHGEGRWNGVAIASRFDFHDVVTNFGDGPVRDSRGGGQAEEDFDPSDEARMVSAVTGDVRFVSLYAPNGRVVGSSFYEGKLHWFERLHRWLVEACAPTEPLVVGGDFNVTPADDDVWDAVRAHGGTHVSPAEREALERLRNWGLVDAFRLHRPENGRFSWWDYRAGMFHRNEGMRIDLLYVTQPVAERVVWAEIDREARKGKPTPSDHAPVVLDLDEPGRPIDAGWDAAMKRIAARQK